MGVYRVLSLVWGARVAAMGWRRRQSNNAGLG